MHNNYTVGILADAAPSPTSSQSIMNSPIPMMVLFGVIFYFILIRPQQKRAKEQRKMLETLKSGDEVITAAGIVATVITVKEKTVMLRSSDAKLEVTKESVTAIIDASTPAKA